MSIVPRRKSSPPKLKSVSYYKKPKKRVDTVSKCKERIQALLRALAIKLWKVCEAAGTPEGEGQVCSLILQADHIESRMFANTYALIENIILLCQNHHLYWKKQHPKRWAALIDRTRGKEKLDELRSIARKSNRTWTLKDWQKAEEKLKEEIKRYTSLLTSITIDI